MISYTGHIKRKKFLGHLYGPNNFAKYITLTISVLNNQIKRIEYPDDFVKVAVLADPQVLVCFWGIFLSIHCHYWSCHFYNFVFPYHILNSSWIEHPLVLLRNR